jgi:membrane peptidoglycan carboxypeptidase
MLVALVACTMLTSGASAATIFFYGENLPSISKLKAQTEFQNTVFLDSTGKHVLYDMADLSKQQGGSRIVEPLRMPGHSSAYYRSHHQGWLVADDYYAAGRWKGYPKSHGIPLALQQATISTEDATFYSNPGFDPLSIARAEVQNLVTGHVVSGASTITQQLVRRYMLQDFHQTLTRKTEEVILAAELTQKYPKTKILWYYLNGAYYGNLSTGAEAAARAYFHQDVWNLDPAQCAFLAGLPEAPTTYNPVDNRQAAINRMKHVLDLMYQHGYLKTNGHPDRTLIDRYMAEANKWPAFRTAQTSNKYPHFVQYAIDQLKQMPNLGDKINDGLEVYTSLDTGVQDMAQATVRNQIDQLGIYHVTDGALVSMDLRPDCYGCIRAMVGSADYNNKAIHGQINMAVTPRQPGSSFKPFNYVYAFQHGLGPGTTVYDGPLAIPDSGEPGGVYAPLDYDKTWHGTVTLRVALQNSLNIPALKVEQYGASCGTCGPNGLWNIADQAMKLGVTSLKSDNPNCCGWSLTLGGMEHGVRLVEETSAYGAFATGGYQVHPTAIVKVLDRTTHKVLWDLNSSGAYKTRTQVLAPEYAYLMNNVLSDDASRCTPQVCEFGTGSDLYVGRPAGAKTGTTNSFTDNWTVGYVPDLVTGVWVGNADNTEMQGTTGVTGAAPIWHDYMLKAFDMLHIPVMSFVQPPGVYSGSLCRLPDAYGSPSTGVFDIWAGVEPYCSVGTVTSSLPVPPQTSTYQPQAVPQAPAAQAPPAVPTAPVAQPTSPPALQPTAAAPAVQPPASTGQAPPAVQPPATGSTSVP